MLLGLSALMDILPDAINGFKLHSLEEASTLPILPNNKSEMAFWGRGYLPSSISWLGSGAM
jgi:hypothetical protein